VREYQYLKVDRADSVLTLTLNRADRLNAWNREMIGELRAFADELSQAADVRVLVITGAGRAFSAGEDVGGMQALAESDTRVYRSLARQIHSVFDTLEELELPVIAAINGVAAGGGLELALACDLRVAAPGVRMGLPEAKIGMGANFATVVLPRRIPMGVALEMLYTGEYVTSEVAERWGLVNRLVPADDVLPTALGLADAIAANAPLSVRRMKATAVKGLELPLWQALRLDVGPNPYLSEDRKEGIAAHLEKRPPRWSGR
jgi:enoyl-CoA hydratase